VKYKAVEKIVKGGDKKIWEKTPVALTAVFLKLIASGSVPAGRTGVEYVWFV
jgi:hypothetical protein